MFFSPMKGEPIKTHKQISPPTQFQDDPPNLFDVYVLFVSLIIIPPSPPLNNTLLGKGICEGGGYEAPAARGPHSYAPSLSPLKRPHGRNWMGGVYLSVPGTLEDTILGLLNADLNSQESSLYRSLK